MSLLKDYAPGLYQMAVSRRPALGIAGKERWTAEYEITQFLPNTVKFEEQGKTGDAGRLVLQYSGEKLTVDHLNLAHPADASRCRATVHCANNPFCSPLEWTLNQRFEKVNDPERRTGVTEAGRVGNGSVVVNGISTGVLSSEHYSSDYSLFAAMPALSAGSLPAFDMLESLTVVRPKQTLRRTGEVVLPDGRVLSELTQKGTGILAWFWWLDESGFPVVSVREHTVFSLQQAGGAL